MVGAGHLKIHGGAELTMVDQVIVHEELGRNTNAVWWCGAGAYNVLGLGTPEQIERYLKPSLRGERADAYAVTERDAGSDASGVAGTAVRTDGGFRIQAEKWFVTTGDVADYYIVMVNVVDGDDRLPTLFLVDRERRRASRSSRTRRSRTTTRTATRRSCSTSRCRPTPCSAARR